MCYQIDSDFGSTRVNADNPVAAVRVACRERARRLDLGMPEAGTLRRQWLREDRTTGGAWGVGLQHATGWSFVLSIIETL